MSTPRNDWAFHYAGPLEAKPDLNCATCLSKARKSCPTHGTLEAKGCAHCAAVAGGDCHGHWGVMNALAYFMETIAPPSAKGEIQEAVALVSLESVAPDKQIDLDIAMSGDLANGGQFAVRIEAKAR